MQASSAGANPSFSFRCVERVCVTIRLRGCSWEMLGATWCVRLAEMRCRAWQRQRGGRGAPKERRPGRAAPGGCNRQGAWGERREKQRAGSPSAALGQLIRAVASPGVDQTARAIGPRGANVGYLSHDSTCCCRFKSPARAPDCTTRAMSMVSPYSPFFISGLHSRHSSLPESVAPSSFLDSFIDDERSLYPRHSVASSDFLSLDLAAPTPELADRYSRATKRSSGLLPSLCVPLLPSRTPH